MVFSETFYQIRDGASGHYEHTEACLDAMCTPNAYLGAMSTRVLVWASCVPGGSGTTRLGTMTTWSLSLNILFFSLNFTKCACVIDDPLINFHMKLWQYSQLVHKYDCRKFLFFYI